MASDIRIGIEHTDFDRVHDWLSHTYWSPGIDRERVERAARGSSLVLNAYQDGEQVGYCRIISDRATFAWVCDVYVAEEARGKGVAREMLAAALAHPEHQDMRRWVLATKDAHGVYEPLGFEPLPEPQRWMIKQRNRLTGL